MNLKWNEVTWYSKLGALILFLLVIPVLTFIIGEKFQQVKEIESQNLQIVDAASQNIKGNVSFSYTTSKVSTASVEFNIVTPSISFSSNKPAENKINDSTKKNIEAIISNSVKNSIPCRDSNGIQCKSNVDITATTSVSSRFNSVSVELDSFLTSEQLAHPDYEREIASTYDLNTGEERKYYDILGIDKTKLFSKLSDLSRMKLKEQFAVGTFSGMEDTFLKGTDANEENYKYVLLTNDGLRIFFLYYQVGARPVGSPEIFITYKELGL